MPSEITHGASTVLFCVEKMKHNNGGIVIAFLIGSALGSLYEKAFAHLLSVGIKNSCKHIT